MVWLLGTVGFLVGFAGGLRLLQYLLRDLPAEEIVRLLKTDKKAKILYGMLNWMCAGAGAIAAVMAWHIYKERT